MGDDNINTYIFTDDELVEAVNQWVATEEPKHPIAKKNARFVGDAVIEIIRNSKTLKRVPYRETERNTSSIADLDINDLNDFNQIINRNSWE